MKMIIGTVILSFKWFAIQIYYPHIVVRDRVLYVVADNKLVIGFKKEFGIGVQLFGFGLGFVLQKRKSR